MADRMYLFQVTCPAGRSSTVPLSSTWAMEDGWLSTITVIIPDGHSGFTGIRFKRAGTLFWPYSGAAWVIANNDEIVVPYNDTMTITGITIETYNTDVFDHTFYMRAVLSDQGPGQSQSPTPITLVNNGVLNLPSVPGTGGIGG